MSSAAFFKTGAFLAGAGVIAGAFGAHSLETLVSPERLATFETGVAYHMYHAFALMIVGLTARGKTTARFTWSGYCFLAGIALFSGSLYALVLTDTSWLGAVTPFGGVAFIAGWILLGLEGLSRTA